jgi:hypothetical protein
LAATRRPPAAAGVVKASGHTATQLIEPLPLLTRHVHALQPRQLARRPSLEPPPAAKITKN